MRAFSILSSFSLYNVAVMSNYVLETENLKKVYKGVAAVDSVCMHVQEGDIYGFVGENGAGKTTIIRLVTGLASPTSGSYSLFGVSNKDPKIHAAKAKLGAIVETVAISPNLTAIENLHQQCLLTGVTKTKEEKEELLRKVGLDVEAIAKKKAGNFSLGMRQRLGIAMTLLSNPSFILLDEPMNGLDPQGFIDMRETIFRLHKEGVTFLISSHILSELEKICNRVGFISHGKLLEELSMEELHEKSRRKIVISVPNASEIEAKLKEDFSLEQTAIEEGKILIYDELDINALMSYLVKEKILIEAIRVDEESIEDYYLNLIMKEAK